MTRTSFNKFKIMEKDSPQLTLDQRLNAVRRDIKRQKQLAVDKQNPLQWNFIDILHNDRRKKEAVIEKRKETGQLGKNIRQHYENVLQNEEAGKLLQSSPFVNRNGKLNLDVFSSTESEDAEHQQLVVSDLQKTPSDRDLNDR